MAWNGSGVFSRLYNWVNDRDAGVKVLATKMDAEDDGLAAGINNCLAKDGQNAATGNINLGTNRLYNVGNPTAAQDAVTRKYLADHAPTLYTDGADDDDYELTASGLTITEYVDGQIIQFEPQNSNAGACTVDVNSLGVRNIKLRGGTTDPSNGDLQAGRLETLIYRASPSAHFELQRTGRIVTTVVTATDATWNPQPDAESIKFEAVGGGGGGGGCQGAGAGTAGLGGGGGSGGYSALTITDVASSYNITIGDAGAVGAGTGGNDGGTGGNTTIVATGVNVSAGGGTGGGGKIANSSSSIEAGGNGGAASGGDVNVNGSDGGTVVVGASATIYSASGVGAASAFGGGVKGRTGTNTGNDGDGYGAGGSGGAAVEAGSNYSGGAGVAGVVVATEYLG